MRSRIEGLATGCLVVSAVLVAAAAVHREFRGVRSAGMQDLQPTFVDGWEQWAADGILVGDRNAPVKIVEFADLQCPFCARFSRALDDVMTDLGNDAALIFIHYPLSYHSEARAAAVAAECAARQGHFLPFVRAVYARQDSLGLKPLHAYAEDAGIPDHADFVRCNAQDPSRFARIDRGVEIGKTLGITGTPTVLINGWWFKRMPYPSDTLAATIRRVLAGTEPFAR